jgi:hypothetical protein
MVSITNYPNSKTLGSLSGISKNLTNRVPHVRNSRFQKILSAFETRNSKNSYKTRGLTIADYRARAVIKITLPAAAPTSRCRIKKYHC